MCTQHVVGDACMQISHVIGPAALAVYALNFNRISFLDTVTGLFGYFLAEKLEPTNLFWVHSLLVSPWSSSYTPTTGLPGVCGVMLI